MGKHWHLLEKRTFRKRKSGGGRPLKITINAETAKAALHDYSVLGAGILIDKKIHAAIGQVVDVACEQPEFLCKAKIIWVRGQRVGLSLDKAIQGPLSLFSISDVFIGLCSAGRTGVLEFINGRTVKKIYLHRGEIVFSTSNDLEDSLGDMLLREGEITRQQYDRSVELLKETGRKQGTILVELGCMKPSEMVSAVYRQLEQICLSVFTLEEGAFRFYEGPLPENQLRLKLSAADLIYRGVKRLDPKEKTGGEDLLAHCIIAPSPYPLSMFQGMQFPVEDRKIIALADGKRDLREILDQSPYPENETLKTVYALLFANVLRVEDVADSASSSAAESEAEPAVPDIPEEQVARINDMHRMMAKYDYYEVLGLWDKKAESAEIKKSYYKAAREFHPDRNFHLTGELTDKLNVIFAGISIAYSTLSDPIKRINYDASLRPGAAAKLAPDPKSATENFNQGRVYYSNKDFKKAEVFFAIAMGLDQKKPEHLFYYGSTLNELGKHKEAVRILHRALALAREDTAILAELGMVYLALGLPERAEDYLKRALMKEPGNRKVIDALLKIKKGKL